MVQKQKDCIGVKRNTGRHKRGSDCDRETERQRDRETEKESVPRRGVRLYIDDPLHRLVPAPRLLYGGGPLVPHPQETLVTLVDPTIDQLITRSIYQLNN